MTSAPSARRPLALGATIATSVAAAAGLVTPAHATEPSPAGTAKLTLSGATNNGTPGSTDAVNGAKYALSSTGVGATDVAWAPTGARAAWVDTNSNAVMTGIPGGATTIIAPAPANGTVRSHPTWIDGGARVVWAERQGSGNWILRYAYANGLDTNASGVSQSHDFRTQPGVDLENPDSVGHLLVFEFNQPGQPKQIYGLDLGNPAAGPYHVATGWNPSLSPDGATVAFIAQANDAASLPANNIYTVPSGSGTASRITNLDHTTPNAFAHPVWAPDGKGIVFEWLDAGGHDFDTYSVTVGGSTTPTAVAAGSHLLGLPAFQPLVKSHVVRLAGTDRLDTAIRTSQSHWATAGASSTGAPAKAVVLSRSDQFADALGGGALAAKVGGPLLLTPTAGLAPNVKTEILRVLGPGDGAKTVYVLGGVQALSPAVAKALTDLNYHVVRLAGTDRYSTAVAIANQITGPGGTPDFILVATGQNYPDALSAGAAAGAINAHTGKNAVVLLTNDTLMPKPTVDFIAPLNSRTKLNADGSKPANFIELDSIGHQAQTALSSGWIPAGFAAGSFYPLSGTDRYQTSFKVAAYFFPSANGAGLATGLAWPDALSGGALMGTAGNPMLLTDPTHGPSPDVARWLSADSGQFVQVDIFGGNNAVALGVNQIVAAEISGPGGVDYPVNPKVN